MSYIKKYPNGIVVIQGDHRGGFGDDLIDRQKDALKTFALLKINNTICYNDDCSGKLDMINSIYLSITHSEKMINSFIKNLDEIFFMLKKRKIKDINSLNDFKRMN